MAGTVRLSGTDEVVTVILDSPDKPGGLSSLSPANIELSFLNEALSILEPAPTVLP